jgi:hypothetical protein
MNIHLRIEQLILEGLDFPPGQQHLLQASVEAELTRLLTVGGLSPSLTQGIALPRLPTSGIQLTSNNPTESGQQIAQSVYGGIGRE